MHRHLQLFYIFSFLSLISPRVYFEEEMLAGRYNGMAHKYFNVKSLPQQPLSFTCYVLDISSNDMENEEEKKKGTARKPFNVHPLTHTHTHTHT
jgi:hypothetical protein